MADELKICEPGGGGTYFPLLSSEQYWPHGLRAVLYVAALLYVFLGVNIIADKFVASIEIITSQKKRVRQKGTGRVVTVAVWNGTVANLTLLALGSSSPEILLSVVETVAGGFHSGELGPGTIVGSAAFNLFIIIAVCVMAVPSTELRKIKERGVYRITVLFSLFAYVWLLVICSVVSPNVIELWEALVTLGMMPALVYISYLADVGYFSGGKQPQADRVRQQAVRLDYDLASPVSALGRHPHFLGQPPLPAELEVRNAHGIVGFPASTWELAVGFEEREVYVPVLRMDGLEGSVTCRYTLEGRTATAGYDFVAAEGELTFAPGEERAFVPVTLLPKRLGEHSDVFQITLEDLKGGAIFDPEGDGGEQRSVLTVTILNENEALNQFSAAVRCTTWLDGLVNTDAWRFAAATWREELRDAVFQVGDDDDDEAGSEDGQQAPSALDYVMHAVSVPWKLLFAVLVPPAPVASGYPCFIMSLVFIGGLTTWVIDFAELFGCVTGVQDSITAITLVALGTSMPDLFASKTSAVQDDWADASIVNVTGSNSVNVFLGIGLPWTIAAIYWQVVGATPEWQSKYGDFVAAYPNGAFVVQSGDLVFSVMVFTIGATLALLTIHFRREKLGGELGGPYMPKALSAMFLASLWFLYCGLSIWKIVAGETTVGEQVFAVFMAFCVLENLLLLAFAAAFFFGGTQSKALAEPVDLECCGGALGSPACDAGLRQTALFGGPRPAGSPLAASYGAQYGFADPVTALSFSNAAMVCLAAKRFKNQASRGQSPLPPPWESSASVPVLQRESSFHSLDSAPAAAGAAGGLRAAAGRVAGALGRNVVDWAALGAAGLAAAQVMDAQPGVGGFSPRL